ncbi:MAG: YeaH/YhbH family protein [Gammaproteobacteria bacterium]|nr:YeaH/YhbH family protein [Gammaproteobacteria bacterium]
MTQFIDRRLNAKNKSAVNRQRFIRRYKEQIKKAIADSISDRSITDLDNGEQVSIPTRDIREPNFHNGPGGRRDMVHPGNKEFVRGDRIKRPSGGGGGGSQASNTGEGVDDFAFTISKEEYIALLFDDLELPNLERNQLKKIINYKNVRAGFVSEGNPSSLSVIRSMKNAYARRIAMTSGSRAELVELKQELDNLASDDPISEDRRKEILLRMDELEAKISKTPFLDTFDLRFHNYIKQPIPTTQAVMFCIMDVSGSMDQATKDMAKRFFILLYLFLTKTYKDVEVVFIRHHTQAKEVDEHEFFYSQETGGTIVSSALNLMDEIIQDRYPAHQWNIYAAQASDGDNWSDDSPVCHEILNEKILPLVRYFAYIEITTRNHQSLWENYQQLTESHKSFAMQHIQTQADIYPVFRELFKRQKA